MIIKMKEWNNKLLGICGREFFFLFHYSKRRRIKARNISLNITL